MAVVTGLSEHQDDWGLENGDRIEVLGFVRNSWQLQAVYRDDEGIVRELPVWAIRMLPNAESKAEEGLGRLRHHLGMDKPDQSGSTRPVKRPPPSTPPVRTNAVAGPQTATPRGVR